MAATLKFVYLSDICVGINLNKRRIFVLKRNETKSLPIRFQVVTINQHYFYA